MVQLTCPTCTFLTNIGSGKVPMTCPACGCLMDGARQPVAWATNIADEQLVADVREAFESTAFDLETDTSRGFDQRAVRSATSDQREAAVALPSGGRLDDFEILDEVGRGGMGIVYRARQASLNREVALKVLTPALHRGGSALRRFRTEAQAVARLRHPNVVPIYAQGEFEGCFYYAMELIEGVSLDVAIHSRPEMLSSTVLRSPSSAGPPGLKDVPPDTKHDGSRAAEADQAAQGGHTSLPRTLQDFRHIARLVADVADGLAHASDHGVIHRDIKPHNLLLGSDGRLHLTDFGLAHLTDEPHFTMSGEVMGTPAYLSPEQARGDARSIDHRTDIYSLGATLYELITRRPPFAGATRDQILTGICMREPLQPRRLDRRIPLDLETICQRAMEKEPDRRYPTAAAMTEDLRRFADGRPILSRRIGPVERGLKWMRRHRAVTAAMLAAAGVLVLSAGLLHSMRGARREQAASLVQTAYDRLTYLDYRRPDLVSDAIGRAQALGADPVQLALTQALANLGLSDNLSAIERLQAVLSNNQDDIRALYLLAWAQWRSGDHQASLATFDTAETIGGPLAPDAWFFRGLAAHFADPGVAVESYRQANAQRARDQEFYPQAVLHLARAHNQQMYVTRTADTFEEAEASLRQLIEHRHYGAYPHYLMSIAHRLAAESHDANGRNAELVSYHFGEALRWARAGQIEDPADDRPVTAEAECLESLERFDEAIEARTRAIGLADQTREQWEGHHYRWRLYYWTNQFAEALADLEACEAFSPHSRFYAFVYPALVYAEMGDVERALESARDIAATDPADAQDLLWSAASLRLVGGASEANALLGTRADSVDYARTLTAPQSAEWMKLLHAYCLGEADFRELAELADDVTSSAKLLGEAHFHAGAMALAQGHRDVALEHFTRAYYSFDGEMAYTFHAKTIWNKMRNDPGWPAWLPPSPANARDTKD